MIRGTTPTHVFKTDADLSDAEVVYVTYQQGSKKLEKTKEDLTFTDTGFELKLTQAETLGFKSGGINAEVQIRARFADGTAVASNVIVVPVSKIIKGGEI